MRVLDKFTTVEDNGVVKSIEDIASEALKRTLASFKPITEGELKQSKDFLNKLAHELVLKMHENTYANYNAVVGEKMVQVFRYQKNSLITLQWNKLITILFRVPLNPQGSGDRQLAIDSVDRKSLASKYASYLFIGKTNCSNRLGLLRSTKSRALR